MPRHTDISLSEARQIGLWYGLTVCSIEHQSHGVENSNYRVNCAEGSYIFCALENRDLLSARCYAGYLADLHYRGVPLPRLIPRAIDGHGEYVSVWSTKPVLVAEFIVGASADDFPRDCLSSLGCVLAEIHATPCPASAPGPLVRLGSRERRLMNNFVDRRFVGWLEDCLKRSEPLLSSRLGVGLTHGDIFPDNLVATPEGEVIVLDWENSAKDLSVLDLGMTLVGMATDGGQFSVERADCVLSGYQAAGGASFAPAELRSAIIYSAAFTAFHRYLKHEVHDRESGLHGHYVKIVDWLSSFDQTF